MILESIKENIILEDKRNIIMETGKLARQADGSVIVSMGNTMILATVVVEKEPKEGVDFLPLTIDYREKYAAGGRIPGGFIKREGRPSDEEILTMRVVDRILRPFFPDNFYHETQIMISLLSYDRSVLPDGLVGLAASAAISISGIPFYGPISAVRIIRIEDNFIINPGLNQVKKSDIDLIVGGSIDSIIMVEGEMKEVSEKEIMEAIKIAHKAIKIQIISQIKLVEKCSINKLVIKESIFNKEDNIILRHDIFNFVYKKILKIYRKFYDKKKRINEYEELIKEFKSKYSKDELEEKEFIIDIYYLDIKKEIIRNIIIEDKIRPDGRDPKQIREISSNVNFLPGVHGSALFTRGETQALATVTLGSSLDANRIDNAIMQDQEKFYLHYNFPPFSTGEVRYIRGVSRREIGHGNLAKRALKNIISDNVPYTIRLVSDILESNGSSSMATVCACTLSLMDAGISIKNPVAGIAMGLVFDKKKNKYIILSDISGDEDHFGDMDFKISGTKNGITACQMDVKIHNLNYNILEEALEQAKEDRLYILKKISETLAESRKEIKPNAPKIITFDIPKDFIGSVIGSGGKVIQEIQYDTETNILIEERDNVGFVEILGKDYDKINQAINRIKKIVFIPQIGNIYKVKVKSIKEFGAFVEFTKGVEALLHISEIEHKRLNKVEDVLKLGDEINVKLIHIDEKSGRMKISRKVLIPRT